MLTVNVTKPLIASVYRINQLVRTMSMDCVPGKVEIQFIYIS